MYQGYKIIANSAVGRRQYCKLLLPQVLASDIVDRYDLWINTLNKLDIAYFEAMAKEFPKLNLCWHPTGEINGIASMKYFYPLCQDEDAIYIKLDDDVVWFDPNFFEEICKFRVENPQYFLVSPLVINNGICNYILKDKGFLKFNPNENYSCQAYDLHFYNGYLAEQIHNWFIDNYLKLDKYPKLYCGINRIAMQKFPINAIAWFGKDFKTFNGIVDKDDEEFLTVTFPVKHDLINCFDCNTIVSHYSFSVQRIYLDKTDILKKYEIFLRDNSNKIIKEYYEKALNLYNLIEKNKEEIIIRNLPEKYHAPNKQRKKFRRKILEKIFTLIGVPKPLRIKFLSIYVNVVRSKREYIVKG